MHSEERDLDRASEVGAEASTTVEETVTIEAIEALKRQLAEEKQKADSFYANWQRAAADFANHKRRTDQERSEATKFATAMLILHLLPVIDDLERALQSVSKELAGLTWIDGILLIYRKLLASLEAQGLKPIEAVGQPFDPKLHEAVLRALGEEGKVLAELQRGYILNDRVIRPSLVKVGTGGLPTPEQVSAIEPRPEGSERSPEQGGPGDA